MQVRILSLLSSAKIKSWQYSLIGEKKPPFHGGDGGSSPPAVTLTT